MVMQGLRSGSGPRIRGLPGTAALAVACALMTAQANASIVGADQDTVSKPATTGATNVSLLSSLPSLIPANGEQSPVRTVLYDGTTLFTGVSFSRLELDIPSAGQLDVLFQDMKFPGGPSGILSFALVDGGTVLGLINGTGSLSYTVDGPTTLFAYVYGVASPTTNVGSYYLSAVHEGLAPVPLPATAWLLLSGIVLSVSLGRRRIEPRRAYPVPA
jgi:hypothetical protein